jgi:hypothetical protein
MFQPRANPAFQRMGRRDCGTAGKLLPETCR